MQRKIYLLNTNFIHYQLSENEIEKKENKESSV